MKNMNNTTKQLDLTDIDRTLSGLSILFKCIKDIHQDKPKLEQ